MAGVATAGEEAAARAREGVAVGWAGVVTAGEEAEEMTAVAGRAREGVTRGWAGVATAGDSVSWLTAGVAGVQEGVAVGWPRAEVPAVETAEGWIQVAQGMAGEGRGLKAARKWTTTVTMEKEVEGRTVAGEVRDTVAVGTVTAREAAGCSVEEVAG